MGNETTAGVAPPSASSTMSYAHAHMFMLDRCSLFVTDFDVSDAALVMMHLMGKDIPHELLRLRCCAVPELCCWSVYCAART